MTRRGLVIGGGGVLGAAWTIGALSALEQTTGADARSFDEYVGTSAGSVLCTLLAAGVGVTDLRTHQLEGRAKHGPLAGFTWDYDEATGGDRPPSLRAGVGSPLLLRKGIRELRQLPPTAVLAALMPEGRGRLDSVGALIRHVVPSGWVGREGLTVVAFDYDAGVRVPFGREGAPVADVADAVMASCAIPGWYQPVRLGERRFIDGGTWSSTNLDLLVGLGLDEVFVLAPQVSFDTDTPAHLVTRLERQWRTRVTARALREMTTVHADGAEVTMIGPGHEDLEAIGGNLMDVSRRPAVIETSLRTSLVALSDPDQVPDPPGPVPPGSEMRSPAAAGAAPTGAVTGPA